MLFFNLLSRPRGRGWPHQGTRAGACASCASDRLRVRCWRLRGCIGHTHGRATCPAACQHCHYDCRVSARDVRSSLHGRGNEGDGAVARFRTSPSTGSGSAFNRHKAARLWRVPAPVTTTATRTTTATTPATAPREAESKPSAPASLRATTSNAPSIRAHDAARPRQARARRLTPPVHRVRHVPPAAKSSRAPLLRPPVRPISTRQQRRDPQPLARQAKPETRVSLAGSSQSTPAGLGRMQGPCSCSR
jgi:hypothetical protein